MTSYSFKPNASTQFVNWNDPTVWAGVQLQDAPDADVDFPTVTQTGTGYVYTSYVSILAGESFAIRSLALRDDLIVKGSLSVSGQLTEYEAGEISLTGGALSAGSIVNGGYDLQGTGSIVVGTLTNNSIVAGSGDLTINATTLVNNGTLAAYTGTTTINVGAGGLSGFSGGSWASGELKALADGILALNAGGAIATDAATITLAGGTITSRDPATGMDVAVTASLHTVSAGGLLDIQSGSYHFGRLEIGGTLSVASQAQFASDALIVDAGGQIRAVGSINTPIVNDGVIKAGALVYDTVTGYGGTLVLRGSVSGNGSIEILPAHGSVLIHVGVSYSGPTLEIAGPLAQNITFDDPYGTLRLDDPTHYSGAIKTASGGANTILLSNVEFSSVTGESYVGNATGGTLTLQQASGAISINFTGSHVLGNFTISGVPGALSSDPTSVKISVAGHGITPVADYNGDGHSDIWWQNANGAFSTWQATGSGSNDGIVQDTYDAHVATSWTAIDSFDFNGDGMADILWRNLNGTIAVWEGSRTGFTQSSYVDSSVPATTAIAGAGDFNGDGRDDVLFRGADGSISAKPSSGATLVTGYGYSYYHDPISTSWAVEGVADFTGDGKADILWRHANGSLSTWNATTSSTGAIDFQEGSWNHGSIDRSWHIVGLGDFNGDGRADLLWRNDNGAVSVWTSTGVGFAENQFNASAATSWSVAQVGDYNGDGLADLLWRNVTGQISIWHSTGAGWAQNTYSDGSVGTDWTIAAHHFAL